MATVIVIISQQALLVHVQCTGGLQHTAVPRPVRDDGGCTHRYPARSHGAATTEQAARAGGASAPSACPRRSEPAGASAPRTTATRPLGRGPRWTPTEAMRAAGWQKFHRPDGAPYYYHAATRTTSWQWREAPLKPTGAPGCGSSAARQARAIVRHRDDAAARGLAGMQQRRHCDATIEASAPTCTHAAPCAGWELVRPCWFDRGVAKR